ncbi:hypothetical protein Daus18300_010288 [Diaporthe australafricana]|uniref:NACHT-NTPase and P-loop NTPases N-terminal domain-containing protein n=1 Tax=Diaporthe australafricana TaxID=127596 RepID=A0ABR3WAY1_9PEZI
MAEALAAIGLASSIVAFVDVAQKVASRLNEFSNDLKDSTNSLIRIQTQLPLILDGLKRIKDRADSGKLNDRAKAALEPVVLECHKQTQRLSDILDSVLPASDASKWRRRKKAILSLTTDRKMKEISEALSQYLQTLTFYHSIGEARPVSVVEKAFWLVPFDRNPAFVGRDAIFGQIDQSFSVPEGTQPKPKCSVFWVNAATVARFEEAFQRMANEFGLNNREDTQNDSLGLVQRWLETEFLHPWIMVIDNVDDETAFFREKCRNDKTPYQVLPRCPHGWLLFTSRSRDVAVDLASPASPIRIEFLTREEGLGLLRKRLGTDPPEADLVELLSELDHIPLAVTQAISFILKRRKSVKQYLELYRMGDTSRSRLLSCEFLDHGRQEQTMESVARTWLISFEWIQKHHPAAAGILCLMSFYQHHGVPERLLRSDDFDAFEFEDSIAALQAFSLLDVDSVGSSYRTHRLIQVTTKWWLEQNGSVQLEEWALRALELVTLRFPPPAHAPADDYWEECQSLLPHADILLQQSFDIAKQESDLEKAKLLIHTGRYNAWAGDKAGDVQRRFKRSLDIRRSHLGLKHPDTLKSMRFHFWSLVFLEYEYYPPDFDSQGAATLGYALLELRREVLGPRHADTIDGMSDLAGLLETREEFEESETLQREATKLSEEVNGLLHVDTFNCMEKLASVLHSMNRFEEALEVEMEVTRIGTSIVGPEHRQILATRSNLAMYLGDAGRVEEAIDMNRDVMRLKETVLGPDHPETLVSARNLASVLANENREKEALDVIGYILGTVQVTRRVYTRSVTWIVRDLQGMKLRYEHGLSGSLVESSRSGSSVSEGSVSADE